MGMREKILLIESKGILKVIQKEKTLDKEYQRFLANYKKLIKNL